MSRTVVRALALLLVLVLPAGVAHARVRVKERPEAGAAKPFFDSRTAERERAGERSARPGPVRRDAITGTVHMYQRLGGALSGPSAEGTATTARRFARANAGRLGVTATDVERMKVASRIRGARGLSVVRFRQEIGGIPFFDSGLRVGLDRASRVVAVSGSPVRAPQVASTTPRLSAREALERLQRNVGVQRAVRVTRQAAGARRATSFDSGDFARLVLFQAASGTRLAWHVTWHATSLAVYDAVVDATSGAVLYRANLVKFATFQEVFHANPGEPGGPHTEDLDPYLDTGATTMSGPFSHSWTDIDDSDDPTNAQGDQEEVDPNTPHPFTPVSSPDGGCSAQFQCAWNEQVRNSWRVNREHSAVQAQWYAGHYHDHLESPAIGFDEQGGNFECFEDPCQANAGQTAPDPRLSDPVQINALDGANTDGAGGPDPAHSNNANMLTPPDGMAPRMQMYLFDTSLGPGVRFRNIDGDDDAGTLYHEYTHGLTSRLVTNDDGTQALNSPHAGAMGEGWSDWYAMDLLVREGHITDDPGVDGEVDIGYYSDLDRHATRFNPQDCPVGSFSAACPGGFNSGPGGFTLGDFGKVFAGPEVHSDGEIWMETLWDLRTALVSATGSEAAGSDAVETLVTNGLRLSPPEPSFLDMRNAILAADVAGGGNHQDLIWEVFRRRGMGFYAAAADGSDVAPVEDFNAPPPADGPKGTLGGRVTDADTGLPISGVPVGLAGQGALEDTTKSDGTYTIGSVPVGSYPKLTFQGSKGYGSRTLSTIAIGDGQTLIKDTTLRFDWAGSAGGGRITTASDDTGAPFGCGAAQLIDQSQGTGWSPFNPSSPDPGNPQAGPPTATIELPAPITVAQFGMDPGNTCGDGPSATTKDFKVETSPDGTNFTVALQGAFTPDQAHQLNLIAPAAGATNVRFVRLTLLSPQNDCSGCSGRDFIDFSEFEVYGQPPNRLPTGTLAATSPVKTNETVKLTASFTDPDSAITGYDWDFDGNGSVDRFTAGPSTETSYPAAGTYGPKVAAKDFRGGAGTASATVTVQSTQGGGGAPTLPNAKPKIAIARSGRRAVVVTITCDSRCTATARLTVSNSVRRKLRLPRRTVGTMRATLTKAGTRKVKLRLRPSVVRAMRRAGVRSIRAAARVSAVDAERQRTTRARRVSTRR